MNNINIIFIKIGVLPKAVNCNFLQSVITSRQICKVMRQE